MTSSFTWPGSVKQASGVGGAAVGGVGLGVSVNATVAGGRVLLGVGIISFGVEQAESRVRSVNRAVLKIA